MLWNEMRLLLNLLVNISVRNNVLFVKHELETENEAVKCTYYF